MLLDYALAFLMFSIRPGCSYVYDSGEIIDLTHELSNETVYWPGDPTFEFNILYREQFDTYWYELNNFSTADHGGTHLDAPSHFSKGKWRVHDIPLTNLIGPGVVIDITARAREDPDTEVQIEDILKWEETYGKLPKKSIILMNSGWAEKWPDKAKVFGTPNVTDYTQFHFPGFSPNVTRWLVENRPYINGIGVDTPSVDYGQSKTFQTHITMCGASIIGFENVANLPKLPPHGIIIFAIPIKIRGGSGSPMRMFAMFDGIISSSANVTINSVLMLCILLLFVFT